MLHALGTLPRPHSLRFEVPYPETRNHNASSLSLTNVGKLGKLNLVCILMQHNKKTPTIEKSFTTVIKGKKNFKVVGFLYCFNGKTLGKYEQ